MHPPQKQESLVPLVAQPYFATEPPSGLSSSFCTRFEDSLARDPHTHYVRSVNWRDWLSILSICSDRMIGMKWDSCGGRGVRGVRYVSKLYDIIQRPHGRMKDWNRPSSVVMDGCTAPAHNISPLRPLIY